MARSAQYDEWEDAGLAFSDDELAAFELDAWCLNHLEEMEERLKVLARRQTIPNVSKPEWTKKAGTTILGKAKWFCVAAGLPAMDLDELFDLPDAKSADGKALTQAAQALEPVEWLPGYRTELEGEVRHLVTIVRRLPTPTKAERSKGNRVVNALLREIDGIEHLQALLDSLPKDGRGK